MAALPVPGLLREGLPLDRIDYAFGELDKEFVVDAECLGPGIPAVASGVMALRDVLTRHKKTSQHTDPIWSGVVARTRVPGDLGDLWKFIAVGLAMPRLRRAHQRLYIPTPEEHQDFQADLVEAFCKRLHNIDISPPNIGGRLVESARGHARRQLEERKKLIPADLTHFSPRLPAPGFGPRRWSESLGAITDGFAAASRDVDAIDMELMARTRIDGDLMAAAAKHLGLGTEAAYKRRQRAEALIASLYRNRRRPGGTQAATTGADATSPGHRAKEA